MALQPNARNRTLDISRRRFVAGCGAALVVGSAGCTDAVNQLADLALGQVNLFNETDGQLSGSITITDPDGETALSASFELAPSDDESGTDEQNATAGEGEGVTDAEDNLAAYQDVWTSSGTYEASVELDDGLEVEGESTASTSFSIENTEEEMLAVPFGAEELEDSIAFVTGTDLSDLSQA